ncbi:peptidase M20 [Pseudoclavibacter endophyticus]|uniref:M20/M25/M40 family metallo-hydrolase n=1 Tax=Pseudoclavibacter endophyticus TaxID=1778590 RepID=A0A6H9WC42_9MICO|nr:M20/M25/M40 family metallo-hydrolase [Pseudoclavibacter endophyticus]KAB1648243.1 M20/M25/M40 family metallo-hydrolase [Pseudoclavibacter endophyticus]GGA70945.1 peptidase M20 [Pseudoclavibacter endophyticus]
MNRDVRPIDPAVAAERLARLIRIDTVSSGDEETDAETFAAVGRELERLYPRSTERCTVTHVGRRCLQYRWDPAHESEPPATSPRATGPLVLMAHADVVPADAADGWQHPPFEGVIAAGSVHGRGALDDKGPLVAIFEAVESLAAEGFEPTRPLIISIGGDEETLGSGGADAAQAIDDAGDTPWLVLDEGGAVVDPPLPFVHGDNAMIGICEKGYASLRLRAVAAPGHSSTPTGPSAPDRLARAITRLQRRPFPAHLSRPVRAMLECLADGERGASRHVIRALAAAGPVTARIFAAIGGEPAALVRTTCAVTMLRAGTAANVSAPDATATLNLRIATGESIARTVRRVRRVIRDRTISIDVVTASEPTPVAPHDGGQFAAIGAAVAASHPGARPVPYPVMATTDSRHFHRRWPHVYRLAPVTMTAGQRASIHGIDEHITIDALGRAIAFHRALIRRSLGSPGSDPDE